MALEKEQMWVVMGDKVYIYDWGGIIAKYEREHAGAVQGCSWHKGSFYVVEKVGAEMRVEAYAYVDRIYWLGVASTFGVEFRAFQFTRESLFLWNDSQLNQYDFSEEGSMVTALKSVVAIPSASVLCFPMDYYFEGVFFDNRVVLLEAHREVEVVLSYQNQDDSDAMYHKVLLDLNFSNSFNSTLTVSLQEYVVSVTGAISPIQDAKMPVLTSAHGAYKFNPRELFNGPIFNVTVDNPNYTVINQVHFNQTLSPGEINDFAAQDQYLYYLNRKGVHLDQATFPATSCYKLLIDADLVYLFCDSKTYQSPLGQLNFTETNLTFARPFQMKIKNANLYLRYFLTLDAYSLDTGEKILAESLDGMLIRDFDVAIDGTVYLLDQTAGVSTLRP